MKNNSNCLQNWISIISVLLLAIGLILNYCQLLQNARQSRYRYMAGVWNQIMQETLNHPEFTNIKNTINYTKTFEGNKLREYEIFVRWLGGYVEDLYYNEYYKKDMYYEPWVRDILSTHKSWFINNKEKYKYTEKLYKRIKELEKN